jgi:TatD DNase family protein
MYIDAHTHLDFFGENIEKAIEDINKNEMLTLANSMDIQVQ